MLGPARVWVLSAVVALVAACTTAPPVQEVRQANAAYEATAAASEPLYDELAAATRRNALREARTAAKENDVRVLRDGDTVVIGAFSHASAADFATIGDPVSVAALRRGLKLVGRYVGMLVILVEGRNVEEAKAQVVGFAGKLAGLAALATGGATVPLGEVLDPVIERILQAANERELRRAVLDGVGPVDDLIDALAAASDSMFAVLFADAQAVITGPLFDNPTAQRPEIQRIAALRVAVANHVVLLRQLRSTLDTLAIAVRAPDAPGVGTAALGSATELLVQAEAVRRASRPLSRPGTGGTP